MEKPRVLILMGSKNDLETMQEARSALSELGIESRMHVASAHRTPEKASALSRGARGEGVKVIIAGAGLAAHLAGAVAANTTLPVIGVPLDAGPLSGLDSLLSTVQMPAGMPVATVAIGKAGARNAGLLAAQIIATSDEGLAERIEDARRKMAEKVDAADRELNK